MGVLKGALVGVLLYELGVYLWHRQMHRSNFLWKTFHQMHHSAERLDTYGAFFFSPLDMIGWTVRNSERKDIELVEPNFRGQTTKEVLPPDELDISRHNGNRFDLNGGRNGNSEYSAGDIWLLPYWMGRYLEVISAAANK